MCKILILFDSDTQKNELLAEKSESVVKKYDAEVRVRRVQSIGIDKEDNEEHYVSSIDIVNKNDLIWADAYIFTFPIHTGTVSASMKYFFDTHHKFALEGVFLNKPATAMSIGKITHAGAETAIQQLYSMLMQWGSVIVSTSILFADMMHNNGNPYGLSFILDSTNSFGDAAVLESVLSEHFKRFVDITSSLKLNDSAKSETNNKPYTITDSLS